MSRRQQHVRRKVYSWKRLSVPVNDTWDCFSKRCCKAMDEHIQSKKLTVPYSIHNTVLLGAKSAMYLGVTINGHLIWNEHVDTVVKKADSTRAFLQQNINICPCNIKEVCYKTFVRTTVEYTATVWDPVSALNIQVVEQVQG